VVHGSDGLGEATITGPSTVFAIDRGRVERITVTPEDFGLAPRPAGEIRGGNAEKNRAVVESILAGQRGAPRDVVLINAALALVAAGKASSFREGAALGAESIDSGAAKRKLDQLREAVSVIQ
jgi:anthranilate phosphoribosyltransferase